VIGVTLCIAFDTSCVNFWLADFGLVIDISLPVTPA
jgi:hypothetical protein